MAFRAGVSLDSLSETHRCEYEEIIGALLNTCIDLERIELAIDLRTIEYASDSLIDNLPIEELIDRPLSKTEVSRILRRRARKLSEILQVEYWKVLKILQKDNEVSQLHVLKMPDYRDRIYGYTYATNQFYWISSISGAFGSYSLSITVTHSLCWVELPNFDLVLTGGRGPTHEAWLLQVAKDASIVKLPDMLSTHGEHCSVYFRGFVYVLCDQKHNRCERLNTLTFAWHSLPPIPCSVYYASAVALPLTHSIYVAGGFIGNARKSNIQIFNTLSLEWSTVEMALSQPLHCMPLLVHSVYKQSIFYVYNKPNLSIGILNVTNGDLNVRSLKSMESCFAFGGCSLYAKGTLYCSSATGPPTKQNIDRLY